MPRAEISALGIFCTSIEYVKMKGEEHIVKRMKNDLGYNRFVGMIIRSAVFSTLLIILSLLFSVMIDRGVAGLDGLYWAAPGICFISSLIGNLLLPKNQSPNAFIGVLINIGLFLLILLVSAILFFDGFSGNTIMNAFGVILGGVLCCLFKCIKRGDSKYKKYRSR